jgi:putative ABC transport system permease protein
MAIGAKASDIRKQFLIESLLLSIAGGLVGVIVGFIGSSLISLFSRLRTIVTSFSVFLALGFSAFIGVTFGYYPAYKASLLNPIDALRYE